MSSPRLNDDLRQRRNNTSVAASNTTMSVSSSSTPLVQTSRAAPSRKQRMLRQMKQTNSMPNEPVPAFNPSLSDLIFMSLRVILGVAVLGVVLTLLYVSPSHDVWQWLDWIMRFFGLPLFPTNTVEQQLPARNLVLLYPAHIPVKRLLPRVYRKYALCTTENQLARQMLRQAQAVRHVATNTSGTPYGQQQQQQQQQQQRNNPVQLHTFEHEDLAWQLPSAADRDAVCGEGFAAAYDAFASTSYATRGRDDLLLFCLLKLGTHDGFVKWNVTMTDTLIRGGIQGWAAKYVHENRVHSSVLLLPILSRSDLKRQWQQQQQQQQQHAAGVHSAADNVVVQPSTLLPLPTLQWIIQRATSLLPDQEEDYVRELEEYLYRTISYEQSNGGRWIWFNAACAIKDRTRLDEEQRRVATTCPPREESVSSNHTDDDDAALAELLSSCCSFYDPSLPPFVRRRRRDEDDD